MTDRSTITVSNHIQIHELDADLSVIETVRRFSDERLLILFDTAAAAGRDDARYSILTADPVETCRLNRVTFGDKPFDKLREWSEGLPRVDRGIPFCGGIAGLLSYDIGHAFERLPTAAIDDFQTPALLAGLYDWAIVWDHAEKSVRLYVLDLPRQNGQTPERRRSWIMQRLTSSAPGIMADTATCVPLAIEGTRTPLPDDASVTSPFSRKEYLEAVERVIEYIRAGDIFQANLAQQLTSQWQGTATDLYQWVREYNPAPFSGLLQTSDFAVISASPERFLKVTDGNQVETRPIKGTRRRHQSPIADLYTGKELHASEKDRAENVMIVDLLRNDLSRVCRPGSVKVTGLCDIEVFETVQHLVSTVVGELRPDRDIWDLLSASVPGGSITGAPKIRAMEIIAELEPAVRGAYCGNLFYLTPNGDFDSSILIRTFTLKNGMVQFPVGGGIVADSLPDDEYAETLHKAAGLLRCLKSGATADSTQSSQT